MNPSYDAAISGLLPSISYGTHYVPQSGNFAYCYNHFSFPIDILFVSGLNTHERVATLAVGQAYQWTASDLDIGWQFIAQCSLTGSFICTFQFDKSSEIHLGYKRLTIPGAIGMFRTPTRDIVIPPNSPLVLVGCGKARSNPSTLILREQYWCRQPDSFSLAAGETKTSNMSVTRGLQETSSNTETIGGAMGVSASAGWGPISTSLNASLNASATFFHQVTVSEQSTVYESKSFSNDTVHSVMYICWQLVDVITLFSADKPVATISVGEPPNIISGPFNPDDLPDHGEIRINDGGPIKPPVGNVVNI